MNNKKMIILVAAGIVDLLWGAVSFYVEQRLDIVALILLICGAALLLTGLIYQARLSPGHLTLARWKSAGIVLLASVLLAAFSFGINYAAALLPWRWDVTQAKQHTLTRGTIEAVQGLKQDVQFSALVVGVAPTYLEDLFREYARVSKGRIKTEIIDPIEQIGYAAQFGNVINGKESKVVVRSNKERRDVDFSKTPLSEEELTNAVMRVTRKERHACFLTGHEEYSLMDKGDQGLTALSGLLAANNMSSREVMLGVEAKVPDDCDVLIVAGPHQALTKKEEIAIEQYLEQGGDALFLVENVVVTTPDKPLTEGELHKNPSLNNVLNQWGLNVEDDVVVDLASHAGDDVGCPVTRSYANHKAITEGLDYTFYVRPRSITLLKDRRPTIQVATIVATASRDKSWGETNRMLQVAFDPLLDTPGPISLGFVVMEEKKTVPKKDTRIILFTDADFLTNIYIDQFSNSRMGLNAINWLTESDPGIFVDLKDIKVEKLDLTPRQRRQVAAILFLIPFLIAASGVIIWLKR